jgi:hypothetical protein
MLNSLRLKFATPGVNTITVHLTELINGAEVEVDTFVVDSTNFTGYHSLMDMFGEHHIAGDNLLITVTVSAGGPYVITGQYQYAMVYTG